MADWQRLAKDLVLIDGMVGERETEILRRAFLADGVINRTEAEFLIDLRNSAPKAVVRFHTFVFEVVKKMMLADGDLTAAEAGWLERFILRDGRVDELERTFLRELKAAARRTSPEFNALVAKYAG
ncbi:hypothetical protein GobsT_28120 [Gemmata obscuriglobus]|uniref:TerB family tellurite resistance protein n=2 Tax=Gemmata TaxID=113 RepID=A0A2Z3H5K9_9BACT|nr:MULTISPECIES: hypothetical protein [Gemmata]AWM38947.1 hypothetical protein C1280_19455 [Gemmata obscuriglobus]MDY3553027.1 hypothetical protein [Gemmata algarum]MDY3563242.1 hypothetical protein [Gemmata algarum]QEG28041.1 hypothetical protein GobsT_28120 [Gemmata obscuriglobus]VTS05610.1 Uncharacterized protein OS=Thioploca ingrica GN=THII_2705 PE=4 SV=1 [Gemmata obscuriglobus UQM 2246]